MLPSLSMSTAHAQITDEYKEKLARQELKVIIPNAPSEDFDTYRHALVSVINRVGGLKSSVLNLSATGGLVALTILTNSGGEDPVEIIEKATDV